MYVYVLIKWKINDDLIETQCKSTWFARDCVKFTRMHFFMTLIFSRTKRKMDARGKNLIYGICIKKITLWKVLHHPSPPLQLYSAHAALWCITFISVNVYYIVGGWTLSSALGTSDDLRSMTCTMWPKRMHQRSWGWN